jgi:shikimate kinase
MADAMSNLMIYLVGPPGVGKYTIGSLVAERLTAKLVDNHHWLNPLFSLIEQDGRTPLPQGIWVQVAQVRRAVFKTMATLSPPDWNFVLTHAATDGAMDDEIAGDVLETARLRNAHLLVVRLTCSPDELARRVVSPERRLRMKETDPEAARQNATLPLFDPGHEQTVTIDTTGLAASETAARIVQMAERMVLTTQAF